jgi:hypothetical protein
MDPAPAEAIDHHPMIKGHVIPVKRGLLRRKQWAGRIVEVGNHRQILRTSESYNNYGDVVRALRLVNPTMPIEYASK